jgi:hypothetical protein
MRSPSSTARCAACSEKEMASGETFGRFRFRSDFRLKAISIHPFRELLCFSLLLWSLGESNS